MTFQHDPYDRALAVSDRISWRLEEVLHRDAQLDFGLPFLPESLVRADAIPGLSESERLTLNHVRAHGYLGTFGLVEEAILPFVLGQVEGDTPSGSLDSRTRALVRFADEEAKHIELFRRFEAIFTRGFGRRLALIGPPSEVTAHLLSHSDLGVALLILHIEWMTQRHYLEQVRGGPELEPNFRSLLRHHWLEEAQHARLDAALALEHASRSTLAERQQAIEEYLTLLRFFDEAFRQQAALDLDGFETALGRELPGATRETFLREQHRSLRETFLLAGLTHPKVQQVLLEVDPACEPALQDAIASFDYAPGRSIPQTNQDQGKRP